MKNFLLLMLLKENLDDKNLSFGSSWLHQDTSYLAMIGQGIQC